MALPIIQNVASPLSVPLAWRTGGWKFDLTREGDDLKVDDTWDLVVFRLDREDTLETVVIGFRNGILEPPGKFNSISSTGTIDSGSYNVGSGLFEFDFTPEASDFPNYQIGVMAFNTDTGTYNGTETVREAGIYDGTLLTIYPRVFVFPGLLASFGTPSPKATYIMTLPHWKATPINHKNVSVGNVDQELSIKTNVQFTMRYNLQKTGTTFLTTDEGGVLNSAGFSFLDETKNEVETFTEEIYNAKLGLNPIGLQDLTNSNTAGLRSYKISIGAQDFNAFISHTQSFIINDNPLSSILFS